MGFLNGRVTFTRYQVSGSSPLPFGDETLEQAQIAKAYIGQLNQAHAFDVAIVTKIELGKEFYPAEGYHQDFLTLHPTQPYIVYNDLPKIDDLKRIFPEFYRTDPVLVSAARQTN